VWAVRSWQRSLFTLVTLVGVWAIVHGVAEIFAAFSVREGGRRAERLVDTDRGAGARTNQGGTMSARPLPMPVNPALLRHAEERRKSLENRIADQITRFAGSMQFVYLHVVWFAAWIGLGSSTTPMGC
jgi:hypothetical protein